MSLSVNPSTLGGIVVSQAPHATTTEPNEEYSLLLPTTSSGQTKVPEVEVPYAEGNNILCCTADDLTLATKLHHFLLGVPYGYLKGWKVTQMLDSGL
ncbi:hypothetical protein RHGRI_020810 [Rhododendron griersonianum]|uniref:Uncharacterized protein n=1 Tax=Rhododendron griersonianum TaxID=479676 RepID=A0AAV6JKZ7_9ERIC|nr:hypothetical protein RHGRI_020810 [Rhododendron griersonianum]